MLVEVLVVDDDVEVGPGAVVGPATVVVVVDGSVVVVVLADVGGPMVVVVVVVDTNTVVVVVLVVAMVEGGSVESYVGIATVDDADVVATVAPGGGGTRRTRSGGVGCGSRRNTARLDRNRPGPNIPVT